MHNDISQIETLGCDFPQTKRGHERRFALLISANDLFLERGYDAVSLDDIVNHAGVLKPQFINILVIKKDYSLRFVIIVVIYFLIIFALNLIKH